MKKWITVAGLLAVLSVGQSVLATELAPPVKSFLEEIFGKIGILTYDCGLGSRIGDPRGEICANYSGTFERFKAQFELDAGLVAVRTGDTWTALHPWELSDNRGNQYVRDYYLNGDRIRIHFDTEDAQQGRLLIFGPAFLTTPRPAPASPTPTTPAPPRPTLAAPASSGPINPTTAYVSLREVVAFFRIFMTLDTTPTGQPRLTVRGTAYSLPAGNNKAFLTSGQVITLPAPVVVQGGVAYVPARFFTSLGCTVNVSPASAQAINIACKNAVGEPSDTDFKRY